MNIVVVHVASISLLVACWPINVLSANSYEDKYFISNLTKFYDPKVRPVIERSEVTTINVTLGLVSIFSLEEKDEILSTKVWLNTVWYDRFLKWNKTDDSPESLFLQISDVWSPSIQFHNTVSDVKNMKDKEDKAIVHNSGYVSYTYNGRLDTRCKVNIKQFPFDQQVCFISMSASVTAYSGEDVIVHTPNVDLQLFEENGEWDLVEATFALKDFSVKGLNQTPATATLTLQRRTMFYILNNILPVVFLSFLNTFVFLLPEESGEKMSLCVSILLSYAVFLTLINSYLPANSDHLCFFSVYVTLLVLISTLTCFVIIFMLALHTHLKSGKGIPRWLRCVNGTNGRVENAEHEPKNGTNEISAKTRDACDEIVQRLNLISFITFFALTALINMVYFIGANE
ncbi:neuronal acetylcholine receptor subunit alpha-7-like [Haliotis rufescens]|uniref:neuronal acetylcholine receptor subunit alpha-7-like n=1 Tax=Haliotis rufescens TaxID=6454 RepID=UPI001EB01A1E|nr:neuronal acetylcholine receptor subunit alpha-7-like [Haliotis rufescens]